MKAKWIGGAMGLWLAAGVLAMAQDPGAGSAIGEGARRPMRPGNRGPGDLEGRALQWITKEGAQKELGLSDEQMANIRRETLDTQKRLIDLKAKLETAALEQVELMRADEPDEAALMKAVEKTGSLRTEIAKLEVQHLLTVRKVLTPEQRTKLREAVKQRVERFRENRAGQEHGTGRIGERFRTPDGQTAPQEPR